MPKKTRQYGGENALFVGETFLTHIDFVAKKINQNSSKFPAEITVRIHYIQGRS